MEPGDNRRAAISLRSCTAVGGDGQDLRWSSSERLPTNNPVGEGILSGVVLAEDYKETQLRSLESQQKKDFLDKLIKVAAKDNERLLLKLKNRLERVGLDIPTVEVRFEHLNVEAEVYVGKRALPTLPNFFFNVLEGLLNSLHVLPSRKRPLSILHDANGIIKPGRMTLLLGPPGSGKTTILLALAGKLDTDLKVSGSVTYNGHEMHEFVPQRTSAYISQYDLHIGEMTVRETLAFSAKCQGVSSVYDVFMELLKREKEANIKPDPDIDVLLKAALLEREKGSLITDYILKILGLDVCADIMVGNEMTRGISGGQRKRVTTGELLVGPSKVFFMDNISTGLDSCTTFQIVNSIRQFVHVLNRTAVISLLQPSPETYNLFDDVLLISEGQIVYHGPRESVLEFFESMGFKCPQRKSVADYLQEVTSRKDQEQYWVNKEKPYSYISIKEFSEAFQTFHVGRKLGRELSTPFDRLKSHPSALSNSKYGIEKKELLKACVSRELLLMKRNSFVYTFKVVQIVMVAVITMCVFPHGKMNHQVENGWIHLGALHFGLTTILFNGFFELPMTIIKLPIFYKHRDLLFYPSWAYSLPTYLLKIPISALEAALWVAITYHAMGFDPNSGRVFKQYLLLLMTSYMSCGLFQSIAALSRNMIIANTSGGFLVLLLIVLGGFPLSRQALNKCWNWAYWASPIMYAQNAIATNEFLGERWKHVLSGSVEALGVSVLRNNGLFTNPNWYWIGVGALIGYICFFTGLYTVSLSYLNQPKKAQAVLSEEALKEKHANRTGETEDEQLEKEVRINSHGESNSKLLDLSIFFLTEVVPVDNQRNKGMLLPFPSLSITFENITYSIDMPQEMKGRGVLRNHLVILNGVSGAFRPGILTAVMGVSGAGKTTLMDVLAGRKTTGYIEGKITISGYPKKQETFARVSGYCEQNDIHSPYVTVYESLLYSAWLRLPSEVDSQMRKLFIEAVMELVELTPLREALVGLPNLNGLMIDQRKRLTIAVELVANPSIIFMDEPTSGLDARAAAIVMRTVKNTAETGRTVVCTIHQPSIDIFESFDELFLLNQGEEIYVGPLGRHSFDMIKYFEGINGVSSIKDDYNPATWMLEVTTGAQEEVLGINFANIYKNSDLYRRNKTLIRELNSNPSSLQDYHFHTHYAQSFLKQCMACLWRQHLSYWRNPSYTATRFLFTTVIALMSGITFWDLGSKRSRHKDLFNAIASMYIGILFIGTQNASSVQPVVAVERAVFYRERATGMYSALPYAFAQVAVEMPYVFIQTLIYGLIVYSMIGFEWTLTKFVQYMFFMFFTFLYFTFYGMMAVAMTPNQNIAAVLSTSFYSVWSLFSGFLVPLTRLPMWLRWYAWVCPVAWTLYGLVASQYGDVQSVLDSGGTVAEFVKDYFGFRHDYLWVVSIMMIGFNVVFVFVFAFSIKAFKFEKR
ncbi:PREDICTED: ABC transporter G family member 39-like isoform X3 [Nelumbo nucifera]|uniref:ABC transporter G family member 39-like isoform X3 n=1 Tax=Nelumbo nucifera TaxID=4432 RepID=A0A1U7ZJU9_NELNU|nr:PREDICTED: ABC transporter G family member 39-like isoform X3 [Nelumbo nucifera]